MLKCGAPAGGETATMEAQDPQQEMENPPKKMEDPWQVMKNPPDKMEEPWQEMENSSQKMENSSLEMEDLSQEKEDPLQEKEDPPQEKEDPPQEEEDPPQEKEDPPQEKEDPPQEKEDPPQEKEDPPQEEEDFLQEKEDPPQEKEDPFQEMEVTPQEMEVPQQENKDPQQENKDPQQEMKDLPQEKEDPPQEILSATLEEQRQLKASLMPGLLSPRVSSCEMERKMPEPLTQQDDLILQDPTILQPLPTLQDLPTQQDSSILQDFPTLQDAPILQNPPSLQSPPSQQDPSSEQDPPSEQDSPTLQDPHTHTINLKQRDLSSIPNEFPLRSRRMEELCSEVISSMSSESDENPPPFTGFPAPELSHAAFSKSLDNLKFLMEVLQSHDTSEHPAGTHVESDHQPGELHIPVQNPKESRKLFPSPDRSKSTFSTVLTFLGDKMASDQEEEEEETFDATSWQAFADELVSSAADDHLCPSVRRQLRSVSNSLEQVQILRLAKQNALQDLVTELKREEVTHWLKIAGRSSVLDAVMSRFGSSVTVENFEGIVMTCMRSHPLIGVMLSLYQLVGCPSLAAMAVSEDNKTCKFIFENKGCISEYVVDCSENVPPAEDLLLPSGFLAGIVEGAGCVKIGAIAGDGDTTSGEINGTSANNMCVQDGTSRAHVADVRFPCTITFQSVLQPSKACPRSYRQATEKRLFGKSLEEMLCAIERATEIFIPRVEESSLAVGEERDKEGTLSLRRIRLKTRFDEKEQRGIRPRKENTPSLLPRDPELQTSEVLKRKRGRPPRRLKRRRGRPRNKPLIPWITMLGSHSEPATPGAYQGPLTGMDARDELPSMGQEKRMWEDDIIELESPARSNKYPRFENASISRNEAEFSNIPVRNDELAPRMYDEDSVATLRELRILKSYSSKKTILVKKNSPNFSSSVKGVGDDRSAVPELTEQPNSPLCVDQQQLKEKLQLIALAKKRRDLQWEQESLREFHGPVPEPRKSCEQLKNFRKDVNMGVTTDAAALCSTPSHLRSLAGEASSLHASQAGQLDPEDLKRKIAAFYANDYFVPTPENQSASGDVSPVSFEGESSVLGSNPSVGTDDGINATSFEVDSLVLGSNPSARTNKGINATGSEVNLSGLGPEPTAGTDEGINATSSEVDPSVLGPEPPVRNDSEAKSSVSLLRNFKLRSARALKKYINSSVTADPKHASIKGFGAADPTNSQRNGEGPLTETAFTAHPGNHDPENLLPVSSAVAEVKEGKSERASDSNASERSYLALKFGIKKIACVKNSNLQSLKSFRKKLSGVRNTTSSLLRQQKMLKGQKVTDAIAPCENFYASPECLWRNFDDFVEDENNHVSFEAREPHLVGARIFVPKSAESEFRILDTDVRNADAREIDERFGKGLNSNEKVNLHLTGREDSIIQEE